MKLLTFLIAVLFILTLQEPVYELLTRDSEVCKSVLNFKVPDQDSNVLKVMVWSQFGDEQVPVSDEAKARILLENRNTKQTGFVRSIIFPNEDYDGDYECPSIRFVLGRRLYKHTMTERYSPESFDTLVCEFPITEDHKDITVHFSQDSEFVVQSLFKRKSKLVKEILFIGDTGCRNSTKGPCSAPKWGFAEVIESMENPEVLIHLGDYRYNKKKVDNMKSWMLEFFCPLGERLTQQPNIFLRGNHETCITPSFNGGDGFYSFFYHLKSSLTPKCRLFLEAQTSVSPSFKITINEWRFIVIDSSHLGDDKKEVKIQKNHLFMKQFKERIQKYVKENSNQKTVLLSHRPLWGVTTGSHTLTLGLQKLFKSPPNVKFIVSAHIHSYQSVVFGSKPNFPKQIVIGNSGVNLVDVPLVHNFTFPGYGVAQVESNKAFGFDLWEYLKDKKWHIEQIFE